MNSPPIPIDALIQSVQESAKYRNVSVDLIRRLGTHELATHKNLKEAIKATKNALHQAGGAYQEGKNRYADWLSQLQVASEAEDAETFRLACRKVMENHASTRERLPFLDTFYPTLFADLPPIRSILDIACGLNPLALPWMPLTPHATYAACDIYTDMMAFLQGFFPLAGIVGTATDCDVANPPAWEPVDLALVLKFLPVLEQSGAKGAGVALLRALPARHILVSFPTRSLSGRGKGMEAHYEARFLQEIAAEPWQIRTYRFPTELCFLITTG